MSFDCMFGPRPGVPVAQVYCTTVLHYCKAILQATELSELIDSPMMGGCNGRDGLRWPDLESVSNLPGRPQVGAPLMPDPSRGAASVEYDDASLRPFHAAVAAASSGGVFSDGYGLGIIGISLSLAAPQLQLKIG